MLELRTVHNECHHPVDLEAPIPHLNISLDTDACPKSFFGRLEESRVIQKLLYYPAPGSINLRPTAWLDGVRGIAALGVYIFHTMGIWAAIVPAWHADENQNNVFQIPIIRTFFVSGGSSVSIFFILSGYVLTHKSLSNLRSKAPQLIAPSVLSSMFRRPFRLYLPPIALTFAEMLATRWGVGPPLNFTFVAEPTLVGQVYDWVKETFHFINPIYNAPRALQGLITHPKYDAVIWTIPLEFYGSLVCYLLLLLMARISLFGGNYSSRIIVLIVLALGSMYLGSWNNFCFLAGMLIADFNLWQVEKGAFLELDCDNKVERHNSKDWIWWITFAAAFYIAGLPTLMNDEARKNPMPGFEILRALIPISLKMEDHARFWWSISGVMILTSSSLLPSLRSNIFSSNLTQYLARISFSLYLVHEFSIALFGLKLQSILLHVVGQSEPYTHNVAYWFVCAVWYAVFSLIVFAIAARVERWVDAPSVRFAKWLEGRCIKLLGY